MQVAALDVVENALGGALVTLVKRCEGTVQLCLCHLDMFAAGSRRIEVFHKLDELGVDVLGIDGSGTRLCDVCLQLIHVVITSIAAWGFHKQLPIAGKENLVGLLIKFHLQFHPSVRVMELIFCFFP